MLKLCFAPTIALLIGLATAPLSAAAAALSPSSRSILSEAKRLSIESESHKARAALESKPRANVAAAVREGLLVGGEWTHVAAKTASVMRLTDVVPDLEKAFATSGDWQLVPALGALANDAQKKSVATGWLTKISKFDSAAQIAIYETLGHWDIPLSNEQFDAGCANESFEIRQAVVREFILTRAKLSVADQIERYKKAFVLKPYQVRLEAMLDFESLTEKDRALVSKAIDADFISHCKAEEKPDVKVECDTILKEAK